MAFAVIVAMLGVLMSPVAACAHVPALEGSGTAGSGAAIGGPDVSRAIYGYLAPGEAGDAYTFTVSGPITRTIGVIVPAYPEHARFRPRLVLTSQDGSRIEFADPGLAARVGEWEPFSLTTFWKGAEGDVRFEPGRRYVLTVEPGPGDATGRYVIVFGGPEQFSGADTLSTLTDLPVIWFGAYGGAPFRWNWPAALLFAALIVIAAGTVVASARRLRRRRG